MKKITSISVALFLATTVSGHGADLLRGSIDAPVASEANWTGAYIGAGVYYGAFSDTDDRFPGFESKGSGLAGSIHAGYMFQMDNNIVVGIEADYAQLDASFKTLPPFFPALEVESVFTLRGRIGMAFDKIQPYVTAGLTYAKTNFDDLEDTGFVAGLGVDVKITDNVLFGIQYQHHRFEDFADDPIDVDHDVATARLSYQF